MENKTFNRSEDLKNAILGAIHNFNPNDKDIEVYKRKINKDYIFYEFEIKVKFENLGKELLRKISKFLEFQNFKSAYILKEKLLTIYTVQCKDLILKPC